MKISRAPCTATIFWLPLQTFGTALGNTTLDEDVATRVALQGLIRLREALCSREEKSECTFRQHLKVEKCISNAFWGELERKKAADCVVLRIQICLRASPSFVFFFWLFRHTVRKDSQQFLSKKKRRKSRVLSSSVKEVIFSWRQHVIW